MHPELLEAYLVTVPETTFLNLAAVSLLTEDSNVNGK